MVNYDKCVKLDTPMVKAIDFWLLAGSLLLAIFVLLEVGRRIGIHRRRIDPESSSSGLGALEGAVFGLMGLLIAFTFSGAATRFDGRRELIGREANAIGTAYLRIDLLPAAAQLPCSRIFETIPICGSGSSVSFERTMKRRSRTTRNQRSYRPGSGMKPSQDVATKVRRRSLRWCSLQ